MKSGLDTGDLGGVITCGKCGNKYLRHDVEVNALDTVVVQICGLCGWRKYGAARIAPSRNIPLASVKGYTQRYEKKVRI